MVAAIGVAIVIAGSDSGRRAPGAAAVPPECAGETAADLRSRLGARIVVRMEGEATRALRRAARAGEIGGVILFPPPDQDPAALAGEIGRLQAAAAEAGGAPLVVAIDQEGGDVKRLPGLPPDAGPRELAADPGAAAEQGRATGAALAEIGVTIDLAPVLDVPEAGSFIASRAFGSSADGVAESGVAFAEGLAEGGVSATAKHFPGLGRSTANTDLAPSEIAANRRQLGADLAPFESAIASGIGLVMLANASYPALDGEQPAFASPPIAKELLRDDLGFDGVTITDDLEAGAVRAAYDRDEAAVAAARAEADLLLFALTSRPGVLDELVAAAEDGTLDPEAIAASCVRVAELRRG